MNAKAMTALDALLARASTHLAAALTVFAQRGRRDAAPAVDPAHERGIDAALGNIPPDRVAEAFLLCEARTWLDRRIQRRGRRTSEEDEYAAQLARLLLFANLVRLGAGGPNPRDAEEAFLTHLARYVAHTDLARAALNYVPPPSIRDGRFPVRKWGSRIEDVEEECTLVLLQCARELRDSRSEPGKNVFQFTDVGRAVSYFAGRVANILLERLGTVAQSLDTQKPNEYEGAPPRGFRDPAAPDAAPETPLAVYVAFEERYADRREVVRNWVLYTFFERESPNEETGWRSIAVQINGNVRGPYRLSLDRIGTDEFRTAFDKSACARPGAGETMDRVLRELKGRRKDESGEWTAEELASYYFFDRTNPRGAVPAPFPYTVEETARADPSASRRNAIRFWMVHWLRRYADSPAHRPAGIKDSYEFARSYLEVRRDLVRCCELMNVGWLPEGVGWQHVTDAFPEPLSLVALRKLHSRMGKAMRERGDAAPSP